MTDELTMIGTGDCLPEVTGHGLVLMRRTGERIFIGDSVVVTLLSVDRNRARLAISAPRGIQIDREEIRMRKINGPSAPATNVESDHNATVTQTERLSAQVDTAESSDD